MPVWSFSVLEVVGVLISCLTEAETGHMLMVARNTTDKTETRYLIFMTGLLCKWI
jgi:hypothetical protein